MGRNEIYRKSRRIVFVFFFYIEASAIKNHLRIAVIDYNVATRYFPDTRTQQYRRLANNYLIPPQRSPVAPCRPARRRRYHLLSRSFNPPPPYRSAYLSLREEILIRTRSRGEGAGRGEEIHPRSTSAEKHIAPVGVWARGATKVSVRSRLTANFGTSKSDFPHA